MEGKDKENKHKQRLKGLFGREKKSSTPGEVPYGASDNKSSTPEEVNQFLYGASANPNAPAPVPVPAPVPAVQVQPPRSSRSTRSKRSETQSSTAEEVNDFLYGVSAKPNAPAPAPIPTIQVQQPRSSRSTRSKRSDTQSSTAEEVNDFLYGASKKPNSGVLAPFPAIQQPRSTNVDTAVDPRWPTAAEARGTWPRSENPNPKPKRGRKGLVVRFTDQQPEVIGFGGDDEELPTKSIRDRAQTLPPNREQRSASNRAAAPPDSEKWFAGDPGDYDTFQPGPIRRTQTGHESVPETRETPQADPTPLEKRSRGAHDPGSFAARVQAEMRAAEGRALMAAANAPENELFLDPEPAETSTTEVNTLLDEMLLNPAGNDQPSPSGPSELPASPLVTSAPVPVPAPTIDRSQPKYQPPPAYTTFGESPDPAFGSSAPASVYENSTQLSRSSTVNQQGGAAADDALHDFASRVVHLFTLFRLSTESVRPLSQCSPEELIRTAVWWFLKGRLNLEATIRDRPTSPSAQQTNFIARQQAYADLAKVWWIIDHAASRLSHISTQQSMSAPKFADLQDTRDNVLSSLKKLAMSMKRNHFLPPDDAPLPQGLDNTIYVHDDGAQAFLQSLRQPPAANISDSLPLGDTSRIFHYGRAFADAVLLEEAEPHQYRFPVLISLVRSQKEMGLMAVVANQSGSLNLCIQAGKPQGLTWEDVTWHMKTNTLDIKRPRAFLLRLKCAQQDFKTMFGVYDHQRLTYLGLKPRQDEEIVCQSTLKTFQYFDHEKQSTFPKEPLPQCQLKVFEKLVADKASSRGRTMHRGFRIGLVTSPKIKSLKGINQELAPDRPLQLGFLRGEGGHPSLLLKIEDGQLKYTMVFTFEDAEERSSLYSKLTGTALALGEEIVSENKITGFAVSGPDADDAPCLKTLKWQNAKVIIEKRENLRSMQSVLTEKSRIILEFRTGTLIDRLNVGSGELKFRLGIDTSKTNQLKIFRQRQHDMTISVSESQVSKDMPLELAGLLALIARSTSVRAYTFPSLKELHLFQAALTGFTVIFDGLASSFNISRRRMVVPLYKKWDAAVTRVQLVQRDKVIQLLAFFENFAHGASMGFVLKSTDQFENTGRSGKFSLRIVDAKFPLPKGYAEAGAADALESGFVCLDEVEYPGEHDDITIVFYNEADHERFSKALPAPVKMASRMASVRR